MFVQNIESKMTEPTKKLNIISLEELKGEINLEKKMNHVGAKNLRPYLKNFLLKKKIIIIMIMIM